MTGKRNTANRAAFTMKTPEDCAPIARLKKQTKNAVAAVFAPYFRDIVSCVCLATLPMASPMTISIRKDAIIEG
jgi:hypothetical protein